MHTVTATLQDLDRDALLSRVRELESLLKNSEARCAKLQYKLDDLLRRMFSPKSEKFNPAQRLLFGLTELPAMLPTPPRSAAGTGGTRGKRPGGRQTPPQNLPVHREVIDLPEEQKAGLVKILEEITEQIEYQPSQFFRKQIVRPAYASPKRACLDGGGAAAAGDPAGRRRPRVRHACAHLQVRGPCSPVSPGAHGCPGRGLDRAAGTLPVRGRRRAPVDHDPSAAAAQNPRLSLCPGR